MRDFDARLPWRNAIRQAVHLPTSVRIVAFALADAVGADGIGEVGVRELAQESGVSVSTVVRAVRRLRQEELVHQDLRGHNTPVGAYVSTWRLASTGQSDVFTGVSTGQPDVFTGVSTGQNGTLTPLNRSRRHVEGVSTGQIDTSLLGLGGEDEETSSSLDVSLTRDGGASLAGPPPMRVPEQASIHEVFRQIPDVVRAKTGALMRRQKLLIAQRLAAGCTVAELITDGYAAGGEAKAVVTRGEPIRSVVGFWAARVREEPDDLVVDVRPDVVEAARDPWDGLDWCQTCDGIDRTVEDNLGRLAPCPTCNPKGIERGQHAAAF